MNTAFESNIKEKRGLIAEIENKIAQISKECEAKGLKLTHLKFERDNIINQLQIDSIRRQEQTKEAREQVKRIDCKKREDEKAYQIAQAELKRQIADQRNIIEHLEKEMAILEKQWSELKQ
jgi:seryl-tRNA synthetase